MACSSDFPFFPLLGVAGGSCGALFGGWVSDRIVNRVRADGTKMGPQGRWVLLFLAFVSCQWPRCVPFLCFSLGSWVPRCAPSSPSLDTNTSTLFLRPLAHTHAPPLVQVVRCDGEQHRRCAFRNGGITSGAQVRWCCLAGEWSSEAGSLAQ